MTKLEKARKEIDGLIDVSKDYSEDIWKDSKEALLTLKDALEKQIPKKAIKKNPICYEKTKYGQEYFAFDYFCPNCNEQIKLSEHHCKCGQALDWSDSE